MKMASDPFESAETVELTQIFGETKPSVNHPTITSVEEGFEKLRSGEIGGFEIALDDNFHPSSVVLRIRTWGPRDANSIQHTIQIKELRWGMEGSGIYQPYADAFKTTQGIIALSHRKNEFYFRAI